MPEIIDSIKHTNYVCIFQKLSDGVSTHCGKCGKKQRVTQEQLNKQVQKAINWWSENDNSTKMKKKL